MLSKKEWPMEEESVSQAYKKIRLTAFIAVVISTASVISAVIALPLLYSQLQTLQSYMTNELDFCKTKSRDLWVEMLSTQDQKGLGHRSKRAWLFGQWVADSPRPILFDPVLAPSRPGGAATYGQKAKPVGPYGVSAPSYEPNRISGGYPNILPAVDVVSDGCCSCQQGPAGPPGQPGLPGNDGVDGKNGTDGKPGKDGVVLPRTGPAPEACQLCPAGPPGPAGLKGPKGGPGVRGPGGEEGSKGTPGRRGPAGDRGIPGGPGAPGLKGPIGEPGKSVLKTGPDGPAGLQGLLGPAGPPGSVGLDGRPGFSGPPGDAGDPGEPGLDAKSGSPGPKGPPGPRGPPGGCGHCPPARTAPGYNPNRVAARS